MATQIEPTPLSDIDRAVAILGGPATMGRKVTNRLDVHMMIEHGFPEGVLNRLVANVGMMRDENSLRKAIGISKRTFFRKQGSAAMSKPLSKEQSGRTWKFAEVLSKATHVLGTQERAEEWLEEPAYGLELQRPIDLLSTPAGIEMVETYLDQIEHGVYV